MQEPATLLVPSAHETAARIAGVSISRCKWSGKALA